MRLYACGLDLVSVFCALILDVISSVDHLGVMRWCVIEIEMLD